jgi:hypothetical protein
LRGRDELVLELQRVRETEELKTKKEAEELEAKKRDEKLKAKKEAEELKAKKEAEELAAADKKRVVKKINRDNRLNEAQKRALASLVLKPEEPLMWLGKEVRVGELRAFPFLEWYNRLRGQDELMLEFQRINKRDRIVLIVGAVIIITAIAIVILVG